MTNTTRDDILEDFLCGELGFFSHPNDPSDVVAAGVWLTSPDETVRFVWGDREALTFELYRFTGNVVRGELLESLRFSGGNVARAQRVIESFL